MIAYVFWHVAKPEIKRDDYETALLNFHIDLRKNAPAGLIDSATYRVSNIPWLDSRDGYEDWCFIRSSEFLDTLNKAAVQPSRWNVHAAIASKTEIGHGGLFYRLYGKESHQIQYYLYGKKVRTPAARLIWLKRPRGIRFESELEKIIAQSTGFVSCWRKQMVLGPGDEFALIGDERFKVVPPAGWLARTVERTFLGPNIREQKH